MLYPEFRKKPIHSLFVVLLLCCASKAAADIEQLRQNIQALDASRHTVSVEHSVDTVLDHEIALGAIRKLHGDWLLEDSERVSGELSSYTWQIIDGFTSREVMEELLETVGKMDTAEQLFSCDGRACGHASQWANRVFGQRVLYGRQDMQRYRVFSINAGEGYRLVVYASARTTERQYLRVDLMALQPSREGPADLALHLQ